MNMKKYVSFIIASMALCAVYTGAASPQVRQQVKDMYPYPAIPDSLATVEERAEYFVGHYWDNYNFADTALLKLPFLTEQGVVDFIDVLPFVPYVQTADALKGLVYKSEAAPETFEHFTGLLDKYLYHPASPFRNDEFYIPVLEAMLESDIPTDTEKTVLRYRLENASKNRVGTVAADFNYTSENGKTRRMHQVKSEYILLMFYYPDCHTCEEATRKMIDSPAIQRMAADKRLTIMAVYPDNDENLWKRHLRSFPSTWINGYNKDLKIENDGLYDIRSIPTFYLLDAKKRVILKDAPLERIEDIFEDMENTGR